jgi:diacylglycerol O-acyltransferase
MANYFYETLSPTDYTFLLSESPVQHMHVTGVMLFKSGPLKKRGGGINFEAISKAYGDVLHQIPRYRQKLMWQTTEHKSSYLDMLRWSQSDESKVPVWVDDPHFKIDYHMRHTALPKPGTEAQLKKLVARVASQQLDRNRPLWEIWVVEGLRGGDHFAVISKTHHCMVDGKSGIDLANIIMHIDPNFRPPEPPPFEPRSAPSLGQLQKAARKEQFLAPLKMVEGVTELWRESEHFGGELLSRAKAIGETFSTNFGKSLTPSPLNAANGPHREVDWLDIPLDYVKAIRKSFDCTVNDVVLTMVTGAFRDYLLLKKYDVVNHHFHIAAPVSIWQDRGEGELGNQIMSWDIELPIHLKTPFAHLSAIKQTTEKLKQSNQALGVKMITSFLQYTPGLMSLAARGATGPSYNSFVTNVPGPQFPVYQLGAEMVRTYPVVPLLAHMGIGIGVMSYNGIICWGITGDPDVVADLPVFMKCLAKAIDKVGVAADCGGVPKVS